MIIIYQFARLLMYIMSIIVAKWTVSVKKLLKVLSGMQAMDFAVQNC